MDTYTVLDVIERRKSGRRETDTGCLALYWPMLTGAALMLLAIGYAIGKWT